jgi:hypothetical protein
MLVTSTAGLGLMALAAQGASGEESLGDQVAWLNMAVFGLTVAGAGHASALIAARRLVTLRRQELVGEPAATTPMRSRPPRGRGAGDQRVRVAGGTWHHDPGCLLVRDKAVEPVVDFDGVNACQVCEPSDG